jgi:hypothetical protein
VVCPGRDRALSADESGRPMARTGLRMMPTFPSPPLKFRTAGFISTASRSPVSGSLPKRRPGEARSQRTPAGTWFASAFAHPPPTCSTGLRCLAPKGNPEGSSPRDAPLTPVRHRRVGSGPSSAVSGHPGLLRPHLPGSQAPGDFTVLPRIPRAFAVRERRGDPRDLPDFPWRAVPTCRRPYPGGSAGPSRS